MKIKLKLTSVALLFCALSLIANGDGILIAWGAGDVPGVTEQSFNAAKFQNVEDIPKKNLAVTSWTDTYLLMVGANAHKDDKTLLKALSAQISNTAKGELNSTHRLIIWERITSGDIQFEGEGYQVSDDLFRVAGRANWMLRNLTRRNFGYVRPNTTEADLANLQEKWTRFLAGEKVDEYVDPYATTEKGLSEIHSLEALEALIVSLAPSGEKERLTKDCLTRIYHLDKLPDDPNSPAALCSPDKYTFRYVAILTGIKDNHDYAWWKTWWETNKNSLTWNRENGRFEVKK